MDAVCRQDIECRDDRECRDDVSADGWARGVREALTRRYTGEGRQARQGKARMEACRNAFIEHAVKWRTPGKLHGEWVRGPTETSTDYGFKQRQGV